MIVGDAREGGREERPGPADDGCWPDRPRLHILSIAVMTVGEMSDLGLERLMCGDMGKESPWKTMGRPSQGRWLSFAGGEQLHGNVTICPALVTDLTDGDGGARPVLREQASICSERSKIRATTGACSPHRKATIQPRTSPCIRS